MFPIMFNDSAIAAGYKCCRTKMRYIVTHGLSKTFKSLLDKKLTETVFSLQKDESNKMYGKKFLIMIVKFYDNELEKITTRFLELKVANKGNASSIVQAILGTFQQHDIPFTNMIQIMSDSPAVMRGKYQGVVTQFRNEHSPHIIDLGGCSLHHVSNAVRNATDKLYKAGDIEEFLQDICTFFNNHVEFAEEFDDLQQQLNIPQHCLIKYIVVRFLSIYPSVKRAIEQYDAIKILFLINIPKYHPKVAKQDRVVRIAKCLNSNIILPSLEFICFILEPFHKYELLFQRSDSTLHLVYNKQVELYRTTLMAYCKFNVIEKLSTDSELVNFDYKKKENHMDKSMITLGVKATKLIKNLTDFRKSIFYIWCKGVSNKDY